jgi:uncharacterized protein (DUF1778 family)
MGHGGRRPGAGRPKNPDKPPARFSFRCANSEYEKIKQAAAIENKSINRYLIDAGIERWKKNCTNTK